MTRKHTPSREYGDPNSAWFAIGETERERRKLQQARYARRLRAEAPQVPNRPWTREEMAEVFTSTETLLDLAIRLNRNYVDVSTLSRELTRQYHEDPVVLMTFIDLSEVQMKQRLAADKGEHFEVCPECFTYPHQISCSHA